MSTQKSWPDRVTAATKLTSTFIEKDENHFEDVVELFAILEVDIDFKYYTIELLRGLKASLEYFLNYQSPWKEEASSLLETTSLALSSAEHRDLEDYSIKSTGKMEKYPFGFRFAKRFQQKKLKPIYLFRIYFLLKLKNSDQLAYSDLTEIARQLSIADKNNRSSLLQDELQLNADTNLEDYFKKIRSTLETHGNEDPTDSNSDLLKVALRKLLGSAKRSRSSNAAPPSYKPTEQDFTANTPKPTTFEFTPKRHKYRIDGKYGNNEEYEIGDPRPLLRDKLHRIFEQEFPGDNKFEPADPSWVLEYKAPIQESASVEYGSDLPSPEEIAAEAARSSRWIVNAHSKHPISNSRLNSIERDRLLESYKESKACDATNPIPLALILMYLTGKSLEFIMSAPIDNPGSARKEARFFTREGQIIRHWSRPSSESNIGKLLKHSTEQQFTVLNLALPKEVSDHFTQSARESPGSTLSQIHDLAPELANEMAIKMTKHWRSSYNPRLKMARLSSALATELSIRYQDPLTVFLLSGSELHNSPTIHYYQAQSKTKLEQRWKETMDALFPG